MPKATRLDHIAIAVRDIDAGIEKWTTLRAGVRIPHREQVGPLRREVLLSPKDTCGVVVQVIEWKEPDAPTLDERIGRLRRFLRTQAG